MNSERKHISALILAAGASNRMRSDITKQMMDLDGESVVVRSVRAFDECEDISSIVVVARADEISLIRDMLWGISSKLFAIVAGGKCRQESALNGFAAIPPEAQFVAVHDAARCLVLPEMISKVVVSALKYGAATAGHPVYDTVKLVNKSGEIAGTLNRDELFVASTPQIFEKGIYEQALKASSDRLEHYTDDNMMVEAIGKSIVTVDVGKENLKITTQEDLLIAGLILERRKCLNIE